MAAKKKKPRRVVIGRRQKPFTPAERGAATKARKKEEGAADYGPQIDSKLLERRNKLQRSQELRKKGGTEIPGVHYKKTIHAAEIG